METAKPRWRSSSKLRRMAHRRLVARKEVPRAALRVPKAAILPMADRKVQEVAVAVAPKPIQRMTRPTPTRTA
jgi:hypothetical protein